jgi:uncharacterized protein DUF1573
MKKLLFFLTLLLAYSLCFSQDGEVIDKKAPIIEFENTIFDFGEIVQGSEAICIFKFKNAGKKPLMFKNVRSSCGCTVPSWPDKPIKRKKQGGIEVQFDTKTIKSFNKIITVYTNAKNDIVRLTIKGEVVPAKENLKSKAVIKKKEITRPNKGIDK